jgi:hypothetical protein
MPIALRVVMNTYETPYTYVDVMNIPAGKWFHVVLNCKRSGLEVFINENLRTRFALKQQCPIRISKISYYFPTQTTNFGQAMLQFSKVKTLKFVAHSKDI